MFLEITPSGRRHGRFSYRRPVTRTQNRISFGTNPDLPLDEAHEERKQARALLAKGIDPSEPGPPEMANALGRGTARQDFLARNTSAQRGSKRRKNGACGCERQVFDRSRQV